MAGARSGRRTQLLPARDDADRFATTLRAGLHLVDGLLVAPEDPRALADALHKLPLGPPTGAALERHAPAGVGAAHRTEYERLLSRG